MFDLIDDEKFEEIFDSKDAVDAETVMKHMTHYQVYDILIAVYQHNVHCHDPCCDCGEQGKRLQPALQALEDTYLERRKPTSITIELTRLALQYLIDEKLVILKPMAAADLADTGTAH